MSTDSVQCNSIYIYILHETKCLVKSNSLRNLSWKKSTSQNVVA